MFLCHMTPIYNPKGALERRKVQIENFVIFYPQDMNEQLKVLESLHVIKEQSNNLQTHYQQKLNNPEELKKSILQKAFRGELA